MRQIHNETKGRGEEDSTGVERGRVVVGEVRRGGGREGEKKKKKKREIPSQANGCRRRRERLPEKTRCRV